MILEMNEHCYGHVISMQEISNVQQFGGGRRLLESTESVSTIGVMEVNSFILHPSCMFGLKFRKLHVYCMLSLILLFFKFSNTLEVAERFHVHMLLSNLPKKYVCVNFMLQKCTLKCML
jgi:hypothetical protein